MRVEQANAIDLSHILSKLGFEPVRITSTESWYLSPFRKEKTPSFHINHKKNIWYDFGEGRGGRVIGFVATWLERQGEDHTLVDALRWLDNMDVAQSLPLASPNEDLVNYSVTLELKALTSVRNGTFDLFLHSRGIPLSIAKKYMKEARIDNKHSGKSFHALALKNENGGYELRNKFFKGCIAPKGITFIRGTKILHDEVHVFEGVMDFFSALIYQKKHRFEGDVIILNSTACLQEAFPYIKNYTYKTVYSWLDNDAAGQAATMALQKLALEEKKFTIKPMNSLYSPHKDVNEWHMHKLELKK